MKLPCCIAGDLIPLFAEELLCQESAALLREHLETCPTCKKVWEDARKPLPAPQTPFAPLKLLKRELNKKRLLWVLLSASLLLALVVSLLAHLTQPLYLPYDQCGVEVWESGGMLFGTLPPQATDYRLTTMGEDTESGNNHLCIELWRTRLSPRGESRTLLLAEDSTQYQGVFYTDNTAGGVNRLLWGSSYGGSQVLPRLTLSYYALLSLLAAGILGVVWWVQRKKASGSRWLKAWLVPLSWLGGQLLVFGFQTVHYEALRPMIYVLAASVFLYVALTCLDSLRSRHIPRSRGA